MLPAILPVIPLADDPAGIDQYRTYHGVRRHRPPSQPGQVETSAHVKLVNAQLIRFYFLLFRFVQWGPVKI
jgi:hypothetical protein